MKLLQLIRIDGKNFDAADAKGKHEISKLATKLQPLEHEILKHPNGVIMISKSGHVLVTEFPMELKQQISDLLGSRS